MQKVTNIQNNSFQSDPFLFPQFIFDNICKNLKPYQFINSSSKEFQIVKELCLLNIRRSDKYVVSDNISIRKIVLNNNESDDRVIYIVFGIDLNPDLEISNKNRKEISKLISADFDPISNMFNYKLVIFGDVVKKAITDPIVLFQDNLKELDPGIISESNLSRYFDIIGLEIETRVLKNIFRFIYLNKLYPNKDIIVGNFYLNNIIYNTLYLALSKNYENNNGICLINNTDQLIKNVILSIKVINQLDTIEKAKFIMNNSFVSDKERFNLNLDQSNLDSMMNKILNKIKVTLNKNFLDFSLIEKATVICENELEEE